jgi:hypothetical protein
MFKKIRDTVILVLLVPLGLALLILLLPFMLVEEYRIKARLKRFRKREAGNFYLVCTRRHGWFEFIRNNVMPILPPRVNITWYRRDRNRTADDISLLLSRSPGVYGVSKPFLVAVSEDDVKVKSLHEDFIELKGHRCKNEDRERPVRWLCTVMRMERQNQGLDADAWQRRSGQTFCEG